MALPYEIVSLGGHLIGPGTGYGAHLDARDDFPVSIGLNTTQRRNAAPTVDSITIDGRTIPMRLSREGSIVSEATFHTNVQQWCNPYAMTAGPVTLVMYAVDGTTQISAPVYVTGRAPIQGEPWSYAVALYLANPALEATTPTTATSSPIVNAGSMTALPSVAFTSATHKTWRPSTVSGAGYGGGLTAVPVRFDLNSTGVSTTNVFVYVNNVSVPCTVGSTSTTQSTVYALIDTAADGSNTVVDIVYGSGLTNPLCGTLPDYGRLWGASAATVSTNAIWRWDDWSSVLTNPRKAPGVWYPAVTGAHLNANVAVGFTASATQIDLTPTAAGTGLIYDSIVMVLPPGAGASAIPTNSLKRLTDASFANARMYLKFKTAGNPNWQTAWSTTAASQTIVTALATLQDAIMVAIGVESTSATLAPAGTASIGFGSLGYLQITLANSITATVGTAANLDYYDGTFQIGSGPSIDFQDFMVADGTLTVDADAKTITSSVAGSPMFGLPVWSDDDSWLEVAPGSNVITNGTGGSYQVSINASYT